MLSDTGVAWPGRREYGLDGGEHYEDASAPATPLRLAVGWRARTHLQNPQRSASGYQPPSFRGWETCNGGSLVGTQTQAAAGEAARGQHNSGWRAGQRAASKRERVPIDFADAATADEAGPFCCAVFEKAHDNVEAELGILVKQKAHAMHLGIAEGQRQAESEVAARWRGRHEHDKRLALILDGVPQVSGRAGGPVVD